MESTQTQKEANRASWPDSWRRDHQVDPQDLLQVPVEDLRPGDFVYNLNIPFFDHPFDTDMFLVDDGRIETIRKLNTSQVVINLARSLHRSRAHEKHEKSDQGQSGGGFSLPTNEIRARYHQHLLEEPMQARALTQESRWAVAEFFAQAHEGEVLNVALAQELARDMEHAVQCWPGQMIALGRMRTLERNTFEHSVNVGVLLAHFAQFLELDRPMRCRLLTAGFLHDIGKVFVPESILTKTDPLTDEEFKTIKMHTLWGGDFLRNQCRVDPLVVDLAEQHHERMDGQGYPYRLRAEQIRREVQMGMLVDVYDALTTKRWYADAIHPIQGVKIVRKDFGDLSIPFIQSVGIYPPGSMVYLSNDHLAFVVENQKRPYDRPLVQVFYDARRRQALEAPRKLDLSSSRKPIKVVGHELEHDWNVDLTDFLWSKAHH